MGDVLCLGSWGVVLRMGVVLKVWSLGMGVVLRGVVLMEECCP